MQVVLYYFIWGRSVMVDAPDGPSVSYTYDVAGRLVGVIYGTATTVLQYDLAGRKLSMDDPDMGDWSYTYDALGNLLTQTDARGCTTTLSYDLINRLENKSYSGSCGATTATVSYIYDQGTNGIGQRTRMDDGTGYTTWSYDARGRVIETYQSVTSGNFRTQWGYNSADLPVWMRYPLDNGGNLGETVNFTYNKQMLLDRVYGTDTYVDDTWYDAAGRVTLRELGTNYTLGQSYAYYPWTQQGGRLQNLESGIAADTDSLQDLSYSYDAVGNVLTITDYKAGGTQIQAFTYDALDRLVSAVASGGTGGTYNLQNYTYNPDTGNLSSNAGVSYTYSDSAHKHAVTSASNGNIYSYDANGNQTSRRVGGITYTLIYDAESRLVQIKRGSSTQAKYFYDGDGNRIRTEVGSTITTYIGSHLEWECINSTCAMKRYYDAAGQRVALRKGDGTLNFLLTDHLGSTAITATSSGGRDAELRYYPWGGTRYTYGAMPTSYRYTGQREAEVGLYYYGARFYDPQLGRFVQADTIIPNPGDPVSFDRFAYVRNNPLRYVDPTGHRTCTDEQAATGDETCDQNIVGDSLIGQIVLPYGMVVPDELPTHINDPVLLEAWLWLYNSAAGRPLAEFIRDNGIQVVVGGQGSGSVSINCLGARCTIASGTPIYMPANSHSLAAHMLAAVMGHEAYHYTRPFGDVRCSLYEEYLAYQITDNVMRDLSSYTLTTQGTVLLSGLIFDGYDPYNPQSLQDWFRYNDLGGYLRYVIDGIYTLYPDGWPRSGGGWGKR